MSYDFGADPLTGSAPFRGLETFISQCLLQPFCLCIRLNDVVSMVVSKLRLFQI